MSALTQCPHKAPRSVPVPGALVACCAWRAHVPDIWTLVVVLPSRTAVTLACSSSSMGEISRVGRIRVVSGTTAGRFKPTTTGYHYGPTPTRPSARASARPCACISDVPIQEEQGDIPPFSLCSLHLPFSLPLSLHFNTSTRRKSDATRKEIRGLVHDSPLSSRSIVGVEALHAVHGTIQFTPKCINLFSRHSHTED